MIIVVVHKRTHYTHMKTNYYRFWMIVHVATWLFWLSVIVSTSSSDYANKFHMIAYLFYFYVVDSFDLLLVIIVQSSNRELCTQTGWMGITSKLFKSSTNFKPANDKAFASHNSNKNSKIINIDKLSVINNEWMI